MDPFMDPRQLYIMYYRQGRTPNLMKNFHSAGTEKDARIRAEQHCKKMGYTLYYVRPFVSDLDKDELHGKYVAPPQPLAVAMGFPAADPAIAVALDKG